MRGLEVVAVVLYLVAPAAPVLAQASPTDTGVVRLQFGWKAGTVADVETTRMRVRQTAEGADSTSVRATYTLRTLAHPDGLLIEYTDFRLPDFQPAGGPQTEFADELVERLAGILPSFVVSPEGEMLRLENVAQLRAQMDSLFAPVLAQLGDVPPELRALMQSLLGDEALTASAAQEWNLLVGTWVGGALEPGAVYGYEAEEPVPLIPGASVPMEYEFALTERTPCTEDTKATDCVVLEMYSAPDPEAMRKLLEEFLRRLAPETLPGAIAFEELDILNTIVVILDPRTLLPHYLYTEKAVEGTIRGPGGEVQQISQVDERTSTFTYRQ